MARYGGEEFVFIAPDTSREGAIHLAEAARRAVEQLNVPHAFSDYGHLTLSIGVALCIPKREDSPDALLRTADAMLYQAKAQGRNRVVAAY